MSSINNKEKNFISAVVYLHNDGARAVEFCRAVAAELDSHFAQYELVVVDDACTDDTVERLRAWGKDQAAPADDFAYEPVPRPGKRHERGPGCQHRRLCVRV